MTFEVIAMLALVVTTNHLNAFAAAEEPPNAPVSRIAIKEGRFVAHSTGKPFTPLGVNYFRVGEFRKGKRGHMTFCPGLYDRSFIEKMMANVAAWGFNVVRTLQPHRNYSPVGCAMPPTRISGFWPGCGPVWPSAATSR